MTNVLIPAVERAAAEGQKVKLLYVLGSDFEGYEAEAAWDDAKMGMHRWGSFDRIGLVTDRGSYRAMAKALGFLMPGEVKVFSVDALEDAKAWIQS